MGIICARRGQMVAMRRVQNLRIGIAATKDFGRNGIK